MVSDRASHPASAKACLLKWHAAREHTSAGPVDVHSCFDEAACSRIPPPPPPPASTPPRVRGTQVHTRECDLRSREADVNRARAQTKSNEAPRRKVSSGGSEYAGQDQITSAAVPLPFLSSCVARSALSTPTRSVSHRSPAREERTRPRGSSDEWGRSLSRSRRPRRRRSNHATRATRATRRGAHRPSQTYLMWLAERLSEVRHADGREPAAREQVARDAVLGQRRALAQVERLRPASAGARGERRAKRRTTCRRRRRRWRW